MCSSMTLRPVVLVRLLAVMTLFGFVLGVSLDGHVRAAWAKGKAGAAPAGTGWSPWAHQPSEDGEGRSQDTGSRRARGTGFIEGCIGPAPKNPGNWNPVCKPPHRKGPSTWELAQHASKLLLVPKPLVKTAPPQGKRELVGIPTWFWLDNSQWTDRSATARAGNVSAKVTAAAYEILIDPGDGSDPFTCGAPWTPYADGGVSNCTHAYTHSGNYTVTVTANWGADWTGSDGNGGTLPTVDRSVRFGVQVVQARSQLIANP